jgi:hypothetical protein
VTASYEYGYLYLAETKDPKIAPPTPGFVAILDTPTGTTCKRVVVVLEAKNWAGQLGWMVTPGDAPIDIADQVMAKARATGERKGEICLNLRRFNLHRQMH